MHNTELPLRCVDINSLYCPCLLADTNHCISCSHLKGEDLCDCNWAGVCILYEKQWQSKNKMRQSEDSPIRIEIESKFTIKEKISDNTYWLEMPISQELAEGLNKIGSFVFLRCPQDPQFYHFPVGVMKIENNNLQVVIEAVGPKSSRIFQEDNNCVLVRGPYYNGVFGQPWIDKIANSKIILLAGGIGQPPALPIVQKLGRNQNQVTAILAPGKTGKVFIERELMEAGIMVTTVTSMRVAGLPLLKKLFQSRTTCPDLVVSAGPDELHYGVIAAMQEAGINLPMAATNNSVMCCGEGICGSCERETNDHQLIRTCKVQTDFARFVSDKELKM
ncbi:Hypothetical protein LUCI_3232 [Lucifera butyrica]|uniref:FAD-binding FR-type domain-containing protein n=1 Tax=Lucifera butyrica TaxID=1351585 RepID=A0A498RAR1_9FIRM|nr:hypothetical protein [Lucifera butyrica]VBB07967.1 Hypothetical protein LUCI_3232 [Lucifera butyrica]